MRTANNGLLWRPVVVLVGTLLLSTPVSAAPLGAAYDYDYGFVEDFDGSLDTNTVAPGNGGHTYWSVRANIAEQAEHLILPVPGSDWGGNADGYNAPLETLGSDRHLAMYDTATANAQNQYLRAKFTNSGDQPLSVIRLRYDLECSWVRSSSNTPRHATFTVQFSTNNFSTYQTMGGFGASVNNSQVSAANETKWFTDAEMDSLGLAARDVGGNFTPTIPVPAGGTFYIQWKKSPGGNDSQSKNMNFGVDNIRSVGPYIKNYDLTNLTYTAADMVGHLVYTGGAPTTVFCYWGPTDGGDITSGLWGKTNDLGAGTEGTYVTNSADLTLFSEKEFFFRFAATNVYATNWASASEYFLNTNVWIVATDTNCSEDWTDAGTFEVRRPASVTAGDLVVNYTIGGSAANGTDYNTISDSVIIGAGNTNAVITITPVNDKITEDGGETVSITIAPGNYLIGALNSQTLTIADNDPMPGTMVHFR